MFVSEGQPKNLHQGNPLDMKILYFSKNIEEDIESAFNFFGMLDLVNWIDNFFIAVVRSIRKKDYVCLLKRTDNDTAEMLVRYFSIIVCLQ